MEIVNTILNHRLWHKHGANAVLAVAILCLLGVLGSVGWTAYSQSKIKQKNYQPQDIAAPNRANKPSYRVEDIVAANLFGDPAPKKVVVKKAPKTTLNLTLQGILWASDDTMARAIIQSGKKQPELYSVGEKIKNAGASVKEIRDAEVLLDRNGAVESLPLVKKKSSGKGPVISYGQSGGGSNNQLAGVNRVKQDNAAVKPIVRPRSANGAPRKIRKPNFSGLDRALKKMGEL